MKQEISVRIAVFKYLIITTVAPPPRQTLWQNPEIIDRKAKNCGVAREVPR
jgi:hypothetical protein